MDAPDPQEAESGRERQRLVQFSIFWSQMVAFGYVPLLDYAGLKNLNVWSLGTPLVSIHVKRANGMCLFLLLKGRKYQHMSVKWDSYKGTRMWYFLPSEGGRGGGSLAKRN